MVKEPYLIILNQQEGELKIMSNELHFKDVLMSHSDQLVGKYQCVSHLNGENYARIWYNGESIDVERTYTQDYLKEHKLGKYNKSTKAKVESRRKRKVEEEDDDDDDTGIPRLLLWPLKALWWLIKQIFSLFGLSFLIGLFSDDGKEEN